MKREENEIQANLKKIREEIERKKKIPKVEKINILKRCLINIIIFIIIAVYLGLLQIGEANLQTENFITILKVLSLILIGATIVLFEISYKTNKNEIILHSIELLVLSLFSVFLISAYSLYYGIFYRVLLAGLIVSAVYYILKCIVIIIKLRKKYYKSLDDIKTIVAK